jgi:hypothetical protein
MLVAPCSGVSINVYTCERCDQPFEGVSYRVMSELLNMVVCYHCYVEALWLGLDTEPVEMNQVTLQ